MFALWIAFVGLVLGLLWRLDKTWRITGLPGPSGLFLLGNILDLGGNCCKTWIGWKKFYGPVFQIRVFNKSIIILNDKDSTVECFNKVEVSGRLGLPAAEQVSVQFGAGVAGETGKQLEEVRQFFMRSFKEFGMTKELLQERLRYDIGALLEDWTLKEGDFFSLHGAFDCFVVNSVCDLLFGTRFDPKEGARVMETLIGFVRYESWQRKFWLFFPKTVQCLRMDSPVGSFNKVADYGSRFIEEHRRNRNAGQPRDVMDKYLDKIELTFDRSSIFYNSEKRSIIAAMRDALIGATTTTTHSFEWTVIYGCCFPESVRKLQSEIDSVIGPSGTPSLNHKEQMPYAEAFILEATRMASVTPFGVPHSALEDFEFRGNIIPKNTIIISNVYGMNHDPQVWQEPYSFKPERFLNADGSVDPLVKARLIPFGSGRRSCIGQVFAVDQNFLVVVNMYQKFTFHLEKPIDCLDGVFGVSMGTPNGVRIRAVLR